MSKGSIADLFQIQNRYLRSIHLERDFHDAAALNGYVLTEHAETNLKRLAAGLPEKSGQKVWRITGDYGSGKSSFALLLSHLFAGKNGNLPTHFKKSTRFQEISSARPQFLPVLVTGSREPISTAILRSLHAALAAPAERRMPKIVEKIHSLLEDSGTSGITDDIAIDAIREANRYVLDAGKGKGLLILLDELGKLLEFAAMHPEQQDVYFMQKLAETAMRSGKNPLFIVGLLHQGFNTYADQLSQAGQKEWEKVAGRFEELVFDQPLEQMAGLVANALNIKIKELPRVIGAQAEFDMEAAFNIGWYGAGGNRKSLISNSARLYPLHPTVLPVLTALFRRFGQNERSLFSFLLSNEPFGLQEFASQSPGKDVLYRLHNLYDYTRAAFGHRLGIQSYRSHWNHIDSVIESFRASDALEIQILKTVGLLNLLDTNNLLPSEEALLISVAGSHAPAASHVKDTLQKLHQRKSILYFRGTAGGYCLWPHTSVNLEKRYEDATKALATATRISALIQKYLETRPLVARRHYIQTGNLRHFDVRYSLVSDLPQIIRERQTFSDGRILIALCESEPERQEALRFAKTDLLKDRDNILFAVPQPLGNLAKLVQETQRWEWVAENTPELNSDTYAFEEVEQRIAASRQTLEKRIQSYLGLRQFTEKIELQWFHLAKTMRITSGRDLLSKLSDICDSLYPQAPKILNELVNRTSVSSAAAAARMRLIERIFEHAPEPFLGMDPTKKPPEMSIYLSVLQSSGLHQETDHGYVIAEPGSRKDGCNVRPALQKIRQILQKTPDGRVKISDIYTELRQRPYGIRDGITPLLLAVFAKANEQDIAFYEGGAFMRQVDGEDFQRIIKEPDSFEIQYCKITGVRADLFERLLALLEINTPRKSKADILDVVKPLSQFAAKLPQYTQKTKRLSIQALNVRTALFSAREPATLLFSDLPKACGLNAIASKESISDKDVRGYVSSLKEALNELKGAYPGLHNRMKSQIVSTFDRPGAFEEVRKDLAKVAESILVSIVEPKLKAFCMRLTDNRLSETEWLESLGSFVCSKPPAWWNDYDEEMFNYEISLVAERFKRVESVTFKAPKATSSFAIRISVTQSDGVEAEQVLHFSKDEEKQAEEIESEVAKLISKSRRVGLIAIARVFWDYHKRR